MRKHLTVGILRESKGFEHRAPLVPSDVEWLVDRGVKVEVESSSSRIFKDQEYKKNGSRIVKKIKVYMICIPIRYIWCFRIQLKVKRNTCRFLSLA